MSVRAWTGGAIAVLVSGCTYHVHIHNHIPPHSVTGPSYRAPPAAVPTPPRAAWPQQPVSPGAQLAPSPYRAVAPRQKPSLIGLRDGAFSSGKLEPGWQAAGLDGGFGGVVAQGTAWSGSTESIGFPSPPHAGLVRASEPASVTSVGMLVSKPFIVAARTLVWKQQSEALDVHIVVEMEDATGGGVVATMEAPPSVGAFAEQQLDVSAACGRTVRVHLRQNTTKAGFGFYTVFDDVAVGGEPCGSGNPYHPTHL